MKMSETEKLITIKGNARLSACTNYLAILKTQGVRVDGLTLTNAFLDDLKELQDIAIK